MSLPILQDFRSLTKNDFRVLTGIEKLMITQSFPKVEELPRVSGFKLDYIQRSIRRLHKLDLIRTHRNQEEYYEVALKYRGYDALALNNLSENNILGSIGPAIGVGKESEVFAAYLEDNTECVIKIHRLGKSSFRATRRHRDYLAEKRHLSRLYESRLSAEREVTALKRLAGVIPVPKVYGNNRHIIVMERIGGDELQKFRHLSVDVYRSLFEELLTYIQKAIKVNIIHADFSAYNILFEPLDDNYRVYIIDWPQYVTTDHLNAAEKLLIDLGNLYSFFGRRFQLDFDDVEILAEKYLTNI